MKRLLMTAALLMAGISAAWAQPAADTSANHTPDMPAVQTSTTTDSGMHPAAGRNSYTMKQAMKHLQDKGYIAVTGLKKDKSGVWRGMATMDGVQHKVALDYKGNITTE